MTPVYYFNEICKIPHGSGNTGAIGGWLVAFAKSERLSYIRDGIGNVIIRKPASEGRGKEKPIILQAHMDMVCVKEDGVNKNLKTEPIEAVTDGDWIYAAGTSLGADDGIGIAIILAVLADKALSHPPIEAVFTVDEEIGMLGAKALDYSLLEGRRMINLDHGSVNGITVGCSGGLTMDIRIPFENVKVPSDSIAYRITVSGLSGGHSGIMIYDSGIANAIQIVACFLDSLHGMTDYRLCSFTGGTAQNVIPSFATAVITVPSDKKDAFETAFSDYSDKLAEEWSKETNLRFMKSLCDVPGSAPDAVKSCRICKMISNIPNGMRKPMEGFERLARQSSNLGVIRTEDGGLRMTVMIRSPYEAERQEIADEIIALSENENGTTETIDSFPGWIYNKNSDLQRVAERVFCRLTGKEPEIDITHGGLEVGYFYDKIKELDCIAMGPEQYGQHSVREKLRLSSVDVALTRLTEILKEI